MSEFMSKFDGGELIGLVAVIGTILCIIQGLAMASYSQWTTHRRNESLAALKQDMLNRGMTADQIQFVLNTGASNAGKAFARHLSRV